MALVLKDRVKEQSTTTGTGTLTLSGAFDGYQAFSVIGNGNVTYYTIYDPASGDWEVGYGTYTSSGTTLSRTFVYDSSNSGNLVDFAAGTKEVFCTYPSEQAVYQETNGDLRLINGVVEVSEDGTSGTTLPNTAYQAFVTGNFYMQSNQQNLSSGAEASSDWVCTANNGTDTNNYMDMGMASSGYNFPDFSAQKPNSGYILSTGADLRLIAGKYQAGTPGGQDIVLIAGSTLDTEERLRVYGDTGNVNIGGGVDATDLGKRLQVVGSASISGAATFGSTVTLSANPSTALQAATKQYVDQQSSTGIHIHTPCVSETSAALSAVYTQGGTTFNITDITGTDTVVTSTAHGLSVDDEIWLYSTAGNGLSTNTAYFVYATPTTTSLQLSTSYGGALLTGLTNASGLTYATRANSGVGAYLEASANQALPIAGVTTSDRVLVYNQSTGYWNGVYTVTSLGSGSSKWKLTRATDANKYEPSNTAGLGAGDYFFIESNSESYVLTNPTGAVIIGYDAITYTLFSSVPSYTVNSPLQLVGTTLSLTTVPANLGGTSFSSYTAGDMLYAAGSTTINKLPIGTSEYPLIVSGGLPAWGTLNLAGAGVSGVLPETHGGTNQSGYATGDTLYASATNTLSKLSGNTSTTRKFLSQTGTGSASQAPLWDTVAASDITSGTLAVARGGTGLGSYAVGDIVYASGTGTLAGLADVATGNVLLSGGTNTAPAYGKVGLATHISGTLGLANGGTGQTTAQAAMNALAGAVTSGSYLRGNGTNVVMATIQAADVPTLNQNTTGSAGSVANALTINNGGAGDVSGSTYNGSAAKTISYNSIGASPLAGSSSLTTTGTVTSGTWSASFGAVSGANLTNLTAGNLSGTIPSAVLGNSTLYVGSTAVALNRASANLAMTGITSVTMPGSVSGTVQVIPAATAGTGTVFTIPATTGTAITSGDTGTVTNTMLAGSIANAKLANSSITINGSAVSLGGSITVTATASNALTIGSYLTGGSYNGSAAVTIAADATSANTASKLVARDASGNFSAGTITATLSGNASTATTATNATNVAVTDDVATAVAVYPAWMHNTTGNDNVQVSSSKLTFIPSTGVLAATTFSGSGASLTSLPAGQLSGTIPAAVLGNSTTYVGTTAVTLNRSSANQALTGISSVTLPGSTSGTIQVIPTAVAGTGTVITLPATTGTVVTTGDTGTVTNTMLAGSIANAKLANSSVTINGSAVSLGGSITVTATATNALTIGTGLSGTSYNGSAAVTIANTGVLSISGGTTGLTPATATTGAVTLAGTLIAANGGTGQASYAVGDILYASTTTALSKLADVATGNALISGGVGVAPSYGKIGLTTHVSGTLPATNGGTGLASYTVGDIVYASTTSALSALADVATGNALISGGVGVAPSYGKIGLTTHVSGTLPVANGGTGAATLTGLAYGNGTSAFTAATAAQVVSVIGTTAVTNATNATNATTATTATTATSATTATNLAGGGAGQLPYQSASGTTAMLAAGTAGYILQSNGTSAPSWAQDNITPFGMMENSATIAANYSITSGNNALSGGPITVNSGVTVTVPSGSTWSVV